MHLKLSQFIVSVLDNTTECKDGKDGICFDKNQVDKIAELINIPNKIAPIEEKIETIKTATGCDSQRCIVESDIVRNSFTSEFVDELESNLKAKGPKNSTEWLNNYNINEKLAELKEKHPDFEYYDTTMDDYAQVGHKLANIEIIKNDLYNKKAVACVINTDTYKSCQYGGTCGQHWVCIFFDGRMKDIISLEYFDSVGKPPSTNILKLMTDCKNGINACECNIHVNQVRHQQKNTECGVYCLFYIMFRLENMDVEPNDIFNDAGDTVRDDQMIKFRRSLFTE